VTEKEETAEELRKGLYNELTDIAARLNTAAHYEDQAGHTSEAISIGLLAWKVTQFAKDFRKRGPSKISEMSESIKPSKDRYCWRCGHVVPGKACAHFRSVGIRMTDCPKCGAMISMYGPVCEKWKNVKPRRPG